MIYDFGALSKTIGDTEEWLSRELSAIRTGRATPTLLDGVRIEAYGSRMALREVAAVSVEDARTLRIVPWDRALVKAIEKGIVDADLGVGVSVDDQGLRVSFPVLTAERREQLSRLASEKTEQARVTLRSHRTDAIKKLDAEEKSGGVGKDEIARLKTEVQKHIDAGNEKLEAQLESKRQEIAL